MTKSAFALVLLVCTAALVSAGDMVLDMERGADIVLHDNQTWEFQNRSGGTIEDDFNVTLDDDRVIRVMTDNTWEFVEQSEEKISPVNLTSVSGQSKMTHIDITTATVKARKNAEKNVAKKIYRAVRGKKLPLAKITECVGRAPREESTDEVFKKGTGWTVQVTVEMDEGSILAVYDCASITDKK